jgi:hypothetical protein
MKREDVEVCEGSPRSAGGNERAATSHSRESRMDTTPFSPGVFPVVPDMVPYPAGASANMKRQVVLNSQANESREILGSIKEYKTSVDTMDKFGGKGKATTSTFPSATTKPFSAQEGEDKCERIRRLSLDSLASTLSWVSEASAASISTVSTTNSLTLPDENTITPFGPTFPESAAASAATHLPPRRGREAQTSRICLHARLTHGGQAPLSQLTGVQGFRERAWVG